MSGQTLLLPCVSTAPPGHGSAPFHAVLRLAGGRHGDIEQPHRRPPHRRRSDDSTPVLCASLCGYVGVCVCVSECVRA